MRTLSSASERGAAIARRYLIPFLEFLCALGGQVVIFAGTQGRLRLNGAFGVGISPTSNTTANLPQSTVTMYDKVFIENLKANTPWVRATSRRTLDANSGNKLALFMYSNLAAPPVTTSPEGTIGTGLTIAVVQNSAQIGQYADYMNISDLALGTAIDPALEALGVQMAYRLARVINTVIQNTADAAAATDTLVDDLSKNATTPLATTDIVAASQSLAGANVPAMESGRYFGITSAFTVGDILTDKTNNSLTDVVKRTAEGTELLRELPSPDGNAIPVIDWGGVTFFQSSLVKKTPNYLAGTGTALRTYIVGKDGVIGVSFGGKDHTQIGEGDWRSLSVWVRRLTEPSVADPSRMVGGYASYNSLYTCTLPPDPVQRIRFMDAVSAIA